LRKRMPPTALMRPVPDKENPRRGGGGERRRGFCGLGLGAPADQPAILKLILVASLVIDVAQIPGGFPVPPGELPQSCRQLVGLFSRGHSRRQLLANAAMGVACRRSPALACDPLRARRRALFVWYR
jgi:hypothetical protein